jgi:hypothetical protein
MYSLVYTSIPSASLTEVDLKDILKKAQVNNTNKNISGCLIYYNNTFVQILEGKKQAIIDLFSKIELDPRHKRISPSDLYPINEQIFSRWTMGYINTDSIEDELTKELFKSNLITYSNMLNKTSETSKLFWTKVKTILSL